MELYYNSGKTVNTERFVSQLFKSPFEFYEKFSAYWEQKEYHRVNHSKAQLYDIFYEFCGKQEECGVYIDEIKQLLKLDMLLSDNLKALSTWVDADNSEEIKRRKRDFYNNAQLVEKYIPSLKEYTSSQLSRMCRIEEFDFDVFSFLKGGNSLKKVKKAVLINYYSRDIITNNAHIIDITEDF